MVPLSRVTGSLAPGLLAPALCLILQDGPDLIWYEKLPCIEMLRSPDWTEGFIVVDTQGCFTQAPYQVTLTSPPSPLPSSPEFRAPSSISVVVR
ncbi:hypothetical protein K438DRAFT_1883201 [Mycena galopus ATCC 62051]|nr:hypothetical protein K438DRAFT_1883201 [Mycena galopus ATCC 62051]